MNEENPEKTISKIQTFQIERIDRSAIKEADYNPRTIDKESRKKLKKKIKEVGLLEPLIWNRRTGNLVSGHQRLSIIDELEKSKDYQLDVSVIDVDEKSEKEINVFLNNTMAQGLFDETAFHDLCLENDLSLDAMGFSQTDWDLTFGENSRLVEEFAESQELRKTKDEIENLKKEKKELRNKLGEKNLNREDFYFTVVFKTQKEKNDFLKSIGCETCEMYVNGAILRAMIMGENGG